MDAWKKTVWWDLSIPNDKMAQEDDDSSSSYGGGEDHDHFFIINLAWT